MILKMNRFGKVWRNVIFIGLLALFMACSSLYNVQRTDCKISDNPSLAVVMVYESEVFSANSPSGFGLDDIDFITDELERLGFDYHNIDPILDESLNYIIKSTIRHDKRIQMIINQLDGNYRYLLYISLNNDYSGGRRDRYLVECLARFKYLGLYDEDDENILSDEDVKALYDNTASKNVILKDGSLSRNSLKSKTLENVEDFLLNFSNNYVKDIINFKKAMNGEEPDC